MIVYKHFLGCTSYKDVKTRYRELAKQLHPDKPTGSQAKFVEMNAEYSILGEGNYYPLKNVKTVYDINEEFKAKYNTEKFKVRFTQEEKVTNINPDEIIKERATNYFNSIRVTDPTFDIIDHIIKTAKDKKLISQWVYQEVGKQYGLNLDHFKYLVFTTNTKIFTANQLFKKYQLSKV